MFNSTPYNKYDSSVVKLGDEVSYNQRDLSESNFRKYLQSKGVLIYDKDIVRIDIGQNYCADNVAEQSNYGDSEMDIEVQQNHNGADIEVEQGADIVEEQNHDHMNIELSYVELIAKRRSQISVGDSKLVKLWQSRRFDNDRIVIEKYNVVIIKEKMNCLSPKTWLNDEVINFYMCMLQERDLALTTDSNGNRTLSHFFNSFMICKLLNIDGKNEIGIYQYKNVNRWTKNVNVFLMSKLFIPVNIRQAHWAMIVVYIQSKRIHYYDSKGYRGLNTYLEPILQWLIDESTTKYNGIYKDMMNKNDWQLLDQETNVPQQVGGYDCGVFAILAADFVSDDIPLNIDTYVQNEIAAYRQKIYASILRGYINH